MNSATVRFEIVDPPGAGTNGRLTQTDGASGPLDHVLDVSTDSDGLAACRWQLDDSDEVTLCQQVTATLLDGAGQSAGAPIRFRARLSIASDVAYSPPPDDCERLAGSQTVQDALDRLCEGRATQITQIQLGAAPLLNEHQVTVDQLRDDGIQLICDGPIDPQSIRRTTSFVTVDVPLGVGTPVELAAYAPRVLAADLADSGPNIVWRLTAEAASWLGDRATEARNRFTQTALLARLTVRGNYVWGTGGGDPLPYLDGDSYGSPAEIGAEDTPEGLAPTRLRVLDGGQLSGDGRRGGDFQMWFWVDPPPNRPPTVNPGNFSVAENAANGTEVGTVSASDPDVGDVLSYAIIGGNTSNAFAIDGTTGLITVNQSSELDFETTPTFNLIVEVSDLENDTATGTITINLVNVNEAPVASSATFSVNENSAAGTEVGPVMATDEDAGDVLTYEITDGNTSDAFAINSSTGMITVNNPLVLDFESTPIFTLAVRVTDLGQLFDTATITINLVDVNERPTAIGATFGVNENSAAGTDVGTVTAFDPDVGDVLTYEITDGNTGDAFAINSSTGIITVNNPQALNFESTPIFTLTVQVTDLGQLSDTATITINLVNVNEPPVASDATFAVNQQSPAGTFVGTVTAIDPDVGDVLTYEITNGNTNGAFAINRSTGQITVANSSAISTPGTFTLTVRVTDTGNLSDTATVQVNVIEIFDFCIDDIFVFVGGNEVFVDEFESAGVGDPPAADIGTWNNLADNLIVSSGDPNRGGQYGCLQQRTLPVLAEFVDTVSPDIVRIQVFFRVSPAVTVFLRLHGTSASETVFEIELDGGSDEYRVTVQNETLLVRSFSFEDFWHELIIEYRPFDDELELTLDGEFEILGNLNAPRVNGFGSTSFQMQ